MTSNSVKPPVAPKKAPTVRLLTVIGAAFVALIVLGILGFTTGTLLEERDSFCISCHTVPETTYVARADAVKIDTNAPVADLATSHFHTAAAKGAATNCISCHRGDSGLMHRAQALTLGLKDTITFISGQANATIEKSVVAEPGLVNAACVGCHEKTLLTVSGNATHFHNMLPATQLLIASGKQPITTSGRGRIRSSSGNTTQLVCTDCHLAHKTEDTSDPLAAKLKLVDKVAAQKACDACHQGAGERPQSIARLLSGGED